MKLYSNFFGHSNLHWRVIEGNPGPGWKLCGKIGAEGNRAILPIIPLFHLYLYVFPGLRDNSEPKGNPPFS